MNFIEPTILSTCVILVTKFLANYKPPEYDEHWSQDYTGALGDATEIQGSWRDADSRRGTNPEGRPTEEQYYYSQSMIDKRVDTGNSLKHRMSIVDHMIGSRRRILSTKDANSEAFS